MCRARMLLEKCHSHAERHGRRFNIKGGEGKGRRAQLMSAAPTITIIHEKGTR